jgi:hypothetical protein
MPKDRTKILITAPVGAESKEARKSTSMFLITINPNIRYDNLESPEAKAMILRLKGLANFLLKKKNIRAGLKFKDRPAKEGQLQIQLSREQHLERLLDISADRSGAVEWGSKHHRLHIHIEFVIEHRTFIHLNKDFYEKVASAFIGKPAKKIHVNFRGATRAEGYKKYVQKNAKEDDPHFFDKSVNTFLKEDNGVLITDE